MKILCVDFDGVIHGYQSGWQGLTVIPDPPVPGALDFLEKAAAEFRVMIYSSRSTNHKGIDAMQRYLLAHYRATAVDDEDVEEFVLRTLEWPTEKPPAFLTLDDRAVCFTGDFPALETLRNFKTWMETENAK